jgi:hypothetical protein
VLKRRAFYENKKRGAFLWGRSGGAQILILLLVWVKYYVASILTQCMACIYACIIVMSHHGVLCWLAMMALMLFPGPVVPSSA